MKVKLTIVADQAALFDAIAAMQRTGGNGTEGIGLRLAGLLLTGQRSIMDCVGLQIYGIEVEQLEMEAGDGQAKN